jgi:hypothetical protein
MGIMSKSNSETSSLSSEGEEFVGEDSRSVTDPDDNIPLSELKMKIRALEKVKEERRYKHLMDKLARLKKEVGVPVSDSLKTRRHSKSKKAAINVQDLRQDEELRRQVRDRLSKLGIGSSDSSTEDEISHQGAAAVRTKNKRQSNKSGIQSSIVENCVNPQLWAHSCIQYPYASTMTQFNDIDLPLFIAGELEIISSSHISNDERIGRTNLLKLLAYKCSKCDWQVVRNAYASWVQQVEIGNKSWKDDPSAVISLVIEDHILSRHLSESVSEPPVLFKSTRDIRDAKNKFGTGSTGRNDTWFCTGFNRNKCKKDSPHNALINGKNRSVSHICATCWRTDKVKQVHPECSSACPHADE